MNVKIVINFEFHKENSFHKQQVNRFYVIIADDFLNFNINRELFVLFTGRICGFKVKIPQAAEPLLTRSGGRIIILTG